MIPIDGILGIRTQDEVEAAAMTLFRLQAEAPGPYREYLSLTGISPHEITSVQDIPFLPVELFKSHRVYVGREEPEAVFSSSTTGGGKPSLHYMARLSDYDKTYRASFGRFYGPAAEYAFFCLLPGYLEREGSSLIRMAAGLIGDGGGGFYLDDYPRLLADMAAAPGKKILLGVSYALWDLAERHAPKLTDTIVMETGGMKGHREELPKEAFHALLCEAFGVGRIHSEYGMAELTSQAYSDGGGVFRAPPWMRVFVRDPNDPFDVSGPDVGGPLSGGLNVIDLANTSSCAFVQTQDLCRLHPDGSFEVSGRADRSEIRGCNLLIQ